MKVLIDSFAAAACAGFIAIAGHGSVVTPVRLVVDARVASVVIIMTLVTGVRAFVIVVCTRFVNLIVGGLHGIPCRIAWHAHRACGMA
jgi:hypothetical protein